MRYFTGVKCIISDIEGTLGSIHFVKQVLFPYARKHLYTYVEQHSNERHVKEIVEQTYQLMQLQTEPFDLDICCEQLLAWMRDDVKAPPLKALQGYIWEEGYRQGDYSAHIYADAYEQFVAWKEKNMPLYIYSSGSVRAQELYFTFSDYGNISALFNGFFDTQLGHKREPESYRKIVDTIAYPAAACLFLSDIHQELDAASDAGMQVCLLMRSEDTPYAGRRAAFRDKYNSVKNFKEIVFCDCNDI